MPQKSPPSSSIPKLDLKSRTVGLGSQGNLDESMRQSSRYSTRFSHAAGPHISSFAANLASVTSLGITDYHNEKVLAKSIDTN